MSAITVSMSQADYENEKNIIYQRTREEWHTRGYWDAMKTLDRDGGTIVFGSDLTAEQRDMFDRLDRLIKKGRKFDTLESRLKWAEEMLERAKEYIQCSDENHSFLSDLAKGFPGGAG